MLIASWLNNIKKTLKDNGLKQILKNSGIVFLGNTGSSAIGFISFTIMARNLGPEGLALIVLAQTYAIVVNDIFNVQTWESLLKFGSVGDDKSFTLNVIKSNLFLDVASAAVATIFAVTLAFPVGSILGWEHDHIGLIRLYSLSIIFNITTLTIGVPRLFNEFDFVAKNQIFFALVKLSLLSIAAYLHKDNYYYLLIYLVIDMLTNLTLMLFSLRLILQVDGKWWRGKVKFDGQQIKFIWWTNLRTIVRIPVQRLDVIIINLIMSTKMVGIFKVYKEIAGILGRLSEPINQAVFPEFTKLIAANKIRQSKDVAKKMISLLFSVSLVCTAVMLIIAKPLVYVFFGPEYMSHIPALLALIFFHWLVFFTTPINSLFIAAGFAKSSFYIVLFSNTIFLLTTFLLGKIIGIYGIIAAYIIQGIINQGLKVFLMERHSGGWNDIVR